MMMTDSPGLAPEQLFENVDDATATRLLPEGAFSLVKKLRSDLLEEPHRAETLGQLLSIELAVDDPSRRNDLLSLVPASKVAELEERVGARLGELRESGLSSKQRRDLLGFFGHATVTERPVEGVQPTLTVPASRGLFPHQKRAASDVERHLYYESGRVMLHLPTGVGKTRTAMSIVASHLRRRQEGLVLWLAATQELLEQTVTEFEATWEAVGDRPVTCLRFWSNHNPPLSDITDGIVVAGLAKLYQYGEKARKDIWDLGNRISLVVFDEAHQAVAKTYRDIVETVVTRNPKTSLLGLSATPGRTWRDIDADAAVAKLFHENKVTLDFGEENPITRLTQDGYLAEVKFSQLMVESNLQLSGSELAAITYPSELPDHIVNTLADDEQRNLSIMRALLDLAKRHDRILVFAASVSHAELLASVCRGIGLHAEVVTGTTDSTERQRIIKKFQRPGDPKQILTNFGVLTAGFDAPAASAALIARATQSLVLYSQMVGRVIRGPKAGGTPSCEVITVVDTNLPGFGDVAEAFMNWEDIWMT